MADKEAAGEAESKEILQTRVRAWWLSVLAGQANDAHPVQGSQLKAHVEGNTLVLSGTVPSEPDRQEIEAEVEHLRGHGIDAVRNELEVAPEADDKPGLLVQTLMSTFETAEQAGFAEGYLEGHAHIRPGLMKVIAPNSGDAGNDAVRAALPQAYWQDAEDALAAGRALLVATVDETEAFRARELLDEETQSLETIVAPPEPTDALQDRRQAMSKTPQSGGDRQVEQQADEDRHLALEREERVHDEQRVTSGEHPSTGSG